MEVDIDLTQVFRLICGEYLFIFFYINIIISLFFYSNYFN